MSDVSIIHYHHWYLDSFTYCPLVGGALKVCMMTQQNILVIVKVA